MSYIISILILLTVILYFFLKRQLVDAAILRRQAVHTSFKNEHRGLLTENEALKKYNSDLKFDLDKTVALYDITKEICKSLEEDKVFIAFKEQVNRYMKLEDCVFIKPDADLSRYKDYQLLVLEINRIPVGYLAVYGLKDEDNDKFNILAQQYVLGVKRAILYQQVQELAITDTLTGVFTRRHFLERLKEEMSYSRRIKQPLSLLILDIDHFKSYNDKYGHLVGDAILRFVSGIIKENLRQVDLSCRYGGEEFTVILNNTDQEGAKLAAERIRKAIENSSVQVYDEDLRVTISIGISSLANEIKDIQTFIDNADIALYRAKEEGRNRVCSFETHH